MKYTEITSQIGRIVFFKRGRDIKEGEVSKNSKAKIMLTKSTSFSNQIS